MSEQPAADASAVPRWDIADRMRKALRDRQISIEDMADYMEVSRRSVGNWINGHVDPPVRVVRVWALRTGVPYTWLCHGDMQPCDLRPVGVSAGQGIPGAISPGRVKKMHRLPTQETA